MKRTTIGIGLMSVIQFCGSAKAATAAPINPLSPTQESQMKSWLSAHGVDATTSNELVAKWESGAFLDSITGKNEVSSETTNTNGSTITTTRFADGSVKIDSAQQPAPSPTQAGSSPQSVGSCQSTQATTTTVTYNFCLVKDEDAATTLTFRATYVIQRGAYDYISQVSDRAITVIGGSYSGESLTIDKKQEDSAGPARAQHSAKVTIVKSGAASTVRDYLYVGGDSARSSYTS